jgi:short-subunit dehydrogenase
MNNMMQQNAGFSAFGYFLFFDEEDAAGLMGVNVCVIILSTSYFFVLFQIKKTLILRS